jgi:hypothetical protein
MPNIRMPDGVVVGFPDEMPPEQIKSLIASKFPDAALNKKLAQPFGANPAPPPGAAQAPGPMDFLTQGMSGLNEGIAMGLGAPVDIATAAINLGTTGVNALAGTRIPQIEKPVGGSQSIREGLLAPTIKPESDDPLLRGVRRVTQEAGAWTVPGLGLAAKTGKTMASAARELPSAVASGTGAAIAQTVAPDNPLAEFAGQMIGGMTPGAVSRAATKPRAPSIDDLRIERDKAYEGVKKLGASYQPQAYDKMLTDLVADVKSDNISPTRHERAYSFITDMIGRRNGKPMTLTELDQLRQEVRRDLITPSYSNPNAAADAHFGDKILDAIDDMIASDTTASQTMKTAREAHSRLRKSEMLADAIAKAQRQAASTGSGGNINNAIRQQVRSILDSPKRSKAFTAAERASMEALIKQGKTEELLRLIGKLSPSGNGLMAALGIGGSMLNPMIGAASLAGLGAKAAADSITTRGATRLQQQVAKIPAARRPPLLPPPALVYAQGANQLQNGPLEITVRGGAR